MDWLPERADWRTRFDEAKLLDGVAALRTYCLLAESRMDLAQTMKLDRSVQRVLAHMGSDAVEGFIRVRLALLGSSTLTHLLPGIRIAGLRHRLLIEVYEPPYGTYMQELAQPASGLHAFAPTMVLIALDARHVAALGSAEMALQRMIGCWTMAKESFGCPIVQQAVMPVFPPLLGNQEYRLADSPAALVESLNLELRKAADLAGVSILALDVFAREDGLRQWYEPGLWYRAKQEVHPAMSPMYGEQVARVVGALLGQSRKCLVLDLDHTLWGGGIGDDGLDGIVLGQGSAAGEAHLELQRYAKSLMRRGVVLAVCSKNDEANALLPFEQHPEMELKREDIACFVANWEDKATNLRHIANTLKLGLDSLVFVDDSPAERGLVRRELPVVAVPEMPVDPADYVRVLASAGYFEGVCVTAEDRERAEHYAANVRRNSAAVQSATDLPAYLSGLRMELEWRSFSAADRVRIVQLINKTNQFNLTTRRRSETEVERLTTSDEALTLQFRLKDIYGDNGMIGVIVAEPITEMEKLPGIKFGQHDLLVSTWLMSCRVLGRQVDEAMMNVLAEQARNRGVLRLFATYVPTAKNEMVREHYARMGFSALGASADGTTWWGLDIPSFQPRLTPIVSRELSASS